MPDDASFDDLLVRLRAGDEAAAALVVDRYAHRLVALARETAPQPSAVRPAA